MDAIHLPNAISLPTTFGAPGGALQAGQVVQALVLELIESDLFRLQTPQANLDVRTTAPLTPGSTVTLAVKGTGANVRLVIYDGAPPAEASVSGAAALSGREPLGEAVIVARGNGGTPAKAPLVANTAPDQSVPLSRPIAAVPQIAARNLSPEQALGEAVRTAVARQSGLAPLFADAEQVAAAPPEAVPPQVRAALQQIVALRVPLDESLTAADVKQAFVRSGVLFEPRLAVAAEEAGAPARDAAPATRMSAPTPQPTAPTGGNDLKAALITLRQVLRIWSDDAAPVRSAPSVVPSASDAPEITRPVLALSDGEVLKGFAGTLLRVAEQQLPAGPRLSPEQATGLAKELATTLLGRASPNQPAPAAAAAPPLRGAPLSAQPAVTPSITPDASPQEAAERLLSETDGAIARTTLLQAASLPEQSAQRTNPLPQRWSFEVPFATPQGTAVAQFEVSRDGHSTRADAHPPTWRARFSLDVEPMGAVHALVALAGPRTSVTFWAERLTTATQLSDRSAMLGDALRAAELQPAGLQFHVGAPPVVAKQATPGRFMDRAT